MGSKQILVSYQKNAKLRILVIQCYLGKRINIKFPFGFIPHLKTKKTKMKLKYELVTVFLIDLNENEKESHKGNIDEENDEIEIQ